VYDDNVNLTAVHSPAVDEFPVGKVTQYTYSDDHNLLTAINPAGQVYLENEYTTTDRVSRQYLGKDAFDFSYYRRREFYQCEPDSDPALEVSRTTVLDRNGNTTELTFNCQGNPLKVTEFTRGIRPSDPDRFTTTYTYNLNGLVTSVTQPEGNRIDYVYDARSTGDKTIDQLFAENRIQITQISDEDRSGGTSLQSNFTYEPVYNQVLTKTDPDSNTITYYYDYQEGSDFAALAARMNMPESTVRTLLRDVPMARGDLNGDSNTAQLR